MDRRVRSWRAALGMAAALSLSWSLQAAEQQCGPFLTLPLRQVQKVVESLLVTKPGQLRVLAKDGSEYTAGDAQWMQRELRLIDEACLRGGDVEAAWRLEQLQGSLISARRGKRNASDVGRSRDSTPPVLSADARMGRRAINVESAPSRLSANTSP
jgi:hypothetical protein